MTTTIQAEAASKLQQIVGDKDISDARRELLAVAIEAGAGDDLLATLRDATRLSRRDTIVLPRQHLETLSRGSGWCRCGRGDSAQWGERTDGGYRVGTGKWTVCGKDGYAREKRVEWSVRHIQVAGETWTIAD